MKLNEKNSRTLNVFPTSSMVVVSAKIVLTTCPILVLRIMTLTIAKSC